MPDNTESSWNEAYDGTPPWDIGRPQPIFVELAEDGRVSGPVLDAGCGTGTHVCYFAERGHTVTGIDVSTRAIELARKKADDRAVQATFHVADAFDLPPSLGPFNTVVDCGLLHVFGEADQRQSYTDELAAVTNPGSRLYSLAFSDEAPDDWGPATLSPDDLRRSFGDSWSVERIEATPYETNRIPVPGYLTVAERKG
ncbi:class I SAM-dependent methyltransferase [Haloferax mediterranei ATCC 33500]|uniref:Class I SAM-dependent methyltransferase n=1 Tax=Haloferax mediterranei (strain ATCC 33500 / DSM 1411 / JCM 8866 / NBRC 14739 / NCIMB 2177 / R-4) TaxID=523841 RepID=I3R7N0_HALMT|nr:class I SAM-dependent methyltransferase [Haloferax mediterranei]AFK20240.1 methyltransferase type 11 [Haloferax mediterranei ATCC 33500]AHZ23610.1 methyltransferase type 11 [Haloferax mediterranei ATCC 33500]ELZ99095.1 type 11 methyltransferase [Haloferax mediterranei ATCC 33500]MDX5987008.1 class I SAM-dependent methyltransferase [Haloferax mediterranei ATCC 33500]QCQ76325.1 class I SAM-dependent methyltransferase [Haloferax mediterranei ATCC 33500]